jgi:hypothetical protein
MSVSNWFVDDIWVVAPYFSENKKVASQEDTTGGRKKRLGETSAHPAKILGSPDSLAWLEVSIEKP